MAASYLRPRKENQRGRHYWVVRLGKKFTATKAEKRYFRTRKAANEFIKQAEKAKSRLGEEAFQMPLELRAEALACARMLKPSGASLTEAVSFFLKARPQEKEQRRLDGLKDEFLRSRRAMNCRPRTLSMYQSHFRIICAEFGDVALEDLHRADIENWLEESGWAPRTKKNYLTSFATLLNFGVKREYVANNPVAQIDPPILEETEPIVLSVEQVKRLLMASKERDQKLTAAIAIALFAGLRRSEICALDWSEVDLRNLRILVSSRKAKTRKARYTGISANLHAWLSQWSTNTGTVAGASSVDVFGERLRKIAGIAEISPWPRNALRHTFASHYFSRTKDEAKTAAELGNSPSVLFRHYRALVSPEETEAFWQITPDSVDEG